MEKHGAAIQPTEVVLLHVAVVLKQEPEHAHGGVGEVFVPVHQAVHVLLQVLVLLLALVQVPALLQRERVRQPNQHHVILTAAQVIHSYKSHIKLIYSIYVSLWVMYLCIKYPQ